jgi:selenocysteine lyase/cysteine desulfurase
VTEALVSRALFPALAHGLYLDTASDGLVPEPVREAAATFWRASAAGEPGSGEARSRVYEGARTVVARLLGADRSLVAVTNSASEALGRVAWGTPLPRGANVVVVDHDFPTVTYAWLRLAKEGRVELRTAPAGSARSPVEEAVEPLIDARTAFVSLSHVHFATGERADLAALASLCHDRGALLAVDVAQSAGVVPLDVVGSGIDVAVGHAAKWLLGETGAGFCYVSERVLERLDPPAPGWRSTAAPWDLDGSRLELAPDARRLEVSSISYLSRFALAEGTAFLLGTGVERALVHALALGAELREGIARLGGTVETPLDEQRRAGIVSASFPGHEAGRLVEGLRAASVAASARGGLLRLSPHIYNDSDDLAGALARLQELVR